MKDRLIVICRTAVLTVLRFTTYSYTLIVCTVTGWETFQRFYNPGAIPPNYYRITQAQRGMIGLGYVGLIGSLALAMDVNERFKKPPEVLVREREAEMSWDMR